MLTQISPTEKYKDKLALTGDSFDAENWTIKESEQFVYFINKNFEAPEQGWKIHLSCLAKEVFSLLQTVAPVLAEAEVSFKVIAHYEDILHFNSGEAGITQIGKIMTVYPRSTEQACRLGLQLDKLWHGSKSPTTPSDLYFRPGGNVSLRFGAINNTNLVTHSDHITYPALISPDAELVPDISSLDGGQISWAPPLPALLSPNAYLGKELDFLRLIDGGRYQIVYPIIRKTFTVTLLCIDTQDKRAVLVKIYCKRSEEDKQGNQFLDKAHNEVAIGRKMAKAGLGPQIFATYEDEYFYYIVAEYLTGNIYAALDKKERLEKLPLLMEKIRLMHEAGIVHRDLKLANIMLRDGDLYFIDFELSAAIGATKLFRGGTTNYMAPENEFAPASPAYDYYSLASCLIHAYTGVDAAALPSDADCRADAVASYIPPKTLALIRALYDVSPDARPTAAECAAHIVIPDGLDASVSAAAKEMMPEEIDALLRDSLIALNKYAVPEEDTIHWPSAHTSHNRHLALGLNTGIGGTLLGLLSIADAQGDLDSHRSLVASAAAYIEHRRDDTDIPPGLFTGLAGGALALGAAAFLYGNEAYLDASYALLQKAADRADEFDLFAGYAGIVFAAVRIFESCGAERFLTIAKNCIDILLANAETVDGITAWRIGGQAEKPRYEPGAAHGTAGIAFAIGLYGVARGSEQYLKIAIKCFKEIFNHARSVEKECFTTDIGVKARRPAQNTNWCHGAAGILWAMAQLPPAFEALKEELDWAIAVCSKVSHLSNPTYCHGTAGSLELWRLLDAGPLRSEVTARCLENTLYELIHISGEYDGLRLFASEYQGLYSPDLWIGWAGTMSALALAKTGSSKSILNTKW